ncbi:Starch-binding associating with outer membrane [Filimonas lacunae]|uniref:Starch-binding associating with outer membrane n=1 Tax=Filimonas lacunae TaxID=477680 RepID=A0A173MEX1_9BACT|nr:RagB/SusD family nutrient uptake outer membrane protein [Filimonas lacunae]BAV06029.1 RagB/SusD domain protein [Filimonas lacunae]SIT24293.1 Starch-binding associating with outer membrane [Filimonas lacunae]
MFNRYILKSLAASCLLVSACSKNLDKSDPNTVPVNQYYKTAAELQSGTNAIYAAMHGNSLVAREWFFVHDLRSDDVATGGGQLEAPRGQILTGATDPTNSVMNAVWNGAYTMIHRANAVIENSPKVTDNTTLRDRCVGEAKFLRAWAYNELVTMWGPVPIYTNTVANSNGYKPRSSEDDVYALIIKDLQDAATVLPTKTNTDKGRATNAAANFLLGRVLMQRGDYTGARTALLKIPTSGADGYSLTNRYLDNFEEETEYNSESVFETSFADKGNNDFNWGNPVGDGPSAPQTTIRNQEYNPVAWRNLIPSNKLLAEYESTVNGSAKTDPRFKYSIYQSGDAINNNTQTLTDAMQNGSSSVLNGATKKISWRKYTLLYKENVSYHPGGDNQRIFRYAEVLLMLAECENELNNIPGAVGYLNQIRNRADVTMPIYPTAQFPVGTKEQVTKALMHEKTVEMACEEVRNIDIIRWRKKGYFTGGDPLSYFQVNRDELLPIPQAEIDNNPQLGAGGINKQNPGY